MWGEYRSEEGGQWRVLGCSRADYFVNEVMTECCSAPEGQISFLSWDLDPFNQSVMMLKDVSGSVQRLCSAFSVKEEEVSCWWLQPFNLSPSPNLLPFWDIIVKYCTSCLSSRLFLHSLWTQESLFFRFSSGFTWFQRQIYLYSVLFYNAAFLNLLWT